MKLMQRHLLETGIALRQIIFMNFESMEYRNMDLQAFYHHVKGKIQPNKRTYLFFDELRQLDRREDAMNSLRVDFDCDIYITGSNAYLLSSEYSTYGRRRSFERFPFCAPELNYFTELNKTIC